MANHLVEFRNVKKRFAHLVVLDGVSLVVERGESVVIIGASGSGKSVLLKHIVGLLRPDDGEVRRDHVGGGVVGRLEARDQLLRRRLARAQSRQGFGKQVSPELRRTTATVGQVGQANRRVGDDGHARSVPRGNETAPSPSGDGAVGRGVVDQRARRVPRPPLVVVLNGSWPPTGPARCSRGSRPLWPAR